MDQFTRHIIGFAIHAGDVDGLALCRMFNTAIYTKEAPQYLSSDHDPLFTYNRWMANLRIHDIKEIKSIPYTPRSHPFIEQLIGTIRREFLDHPLFWNVVDLEQKLDTFKEYYNRSRTHASLGGNKPAEIGCDHVAQPARLETYAWEKHCGGLFQLPVAA